MSYTMNKQDIINVVVYTKKTPANYSNIVNDEWIILLGQALEPTNNF